MADIQNIAINTLGSGQQVYSSLKGHPDLVHFIDPVSNSTLLQFDAVLSENHSRESPATRFPVENGSSITDHITIEPFELQIQGLITDSPIGSASALITEGVTSALSAVVPPLGVATAGAAYALYTAQNNATSRSKAAFTALLRLQAGDATASPPIPPKPFDVVTKYFRYPPMSIKSLSLPRDPTLSNAILFSVSLEQILVVRPQAVNVQILSNPGLAAAKAKAGEQELEDINGFDAGKKAFTQNVDTVSKFKETVVGGIKGLVGAK